MVCASVMDLGLLLGVSGVRTVETSQKQEADLNCPSLPLDFSRGAYIADASLHPVLDFSQKWEISGEFSPCVSLYMSSFITICTRKVLRAHDITFISERRAARELINEMHLWLRFVLWVGQKHLVH